MKMTKAKIYQTLIDQHKDIIDYKAWAIYYRDWDGDMNGRENSIRGYRHQSFGLNNIVRKILNANEYDLFLKSFSSITQTMWYKNRRFNYDGTPYVPTTEEYQQTTLEESAA